MAETLTTDLGNGEQIADILRSLGISESHIHISLQRQRLTGEMLHAIMQDFGFLSPEQVAEVVSRQTGLPYEPASVIDDVDMDLADEIDLKTFRGFCPVRKLKSGNLLVLAPDVDAINHAQNALYKYHPEFRIASLHTVQTVYRRYFARTDHEFDRLVNIFYELAGADDDPESTQALQRVYWALLRHVCYSGASDLYLHKTEQDVGVIRLKLNGVGSLFRTITSELFERLARKVVMEAQVKEEDLLRGPKDAVLVMSDADKREYPDIATRFAFRLSLADSRGGRSVVMRILDNQSSVSKVEHLGFTPRVMASLRSMVDAPTGLIIVTGPTGSGKTTTLNALMSSVDPVERSVQSIENPVEYVKGLWLQHEVVKQSNDESADFKRWLKALLRRAPDVILMGEVRDAEAAAILLDAANTGHLALTTMHTNNAVLAFSRLRRFGLDASALASVLLGILAQRLVRTLCPHCKIVDDDADARAMLVERGHASPTLFKPGPGCAKCGLTGHRGRHMVYELLEVTPKVRALIERGEPPSVIAKEAMPAERTMHGSGLALVAAGTVSLRELNRVTGNIYEDAD